MANLNPYISFKNNARDALEYYQSVFGGELSIDTFENFGDMVQDPAEKTLVMHGQLITDDGFVLMASDSPTGMPYQAPAGISVSVSGDDEAQLEGYWNKLSADGTVVMPFEVPPWGGRFGMVNDKFGVAWMIAATPPAE